MATPSDSEMLSQGSQIGSCRIVRRIGRGGMGEVYEAEHVRLGVAYAIKVFPLEGRDAAFLTKRFLAEGRLLARLDHPRIVRVHDMGKTDRFAWFTMDYVTGPEGRPQTLADVPQAGGLPERTLAGWYEDMREALAVVHGAGIVHRDVKLENMLVGKDGRAVLSDFGISRIVDERLRESVAVTRTMVSTDAKAKTVLGTVAYLAPEVRAGGSPTAASDLYALGVAFFRLLTGLWYEAGPHAFDLLAPFDRRWRMVLAGLLAADPQQRRAESFRPTRRDGGSVWKGLALGSLVLWAVLAGLWIWTHFGAVEAPQQEAPSEDEFAIPESLR